MSIISLVTRLYHAMTQFLLPLPQQQLGNNSTQVWQTLFEDWILNLHKTRPKALPSLLFQSVNLWMPEKITEMALYMECKKTLKWMCLGRKGSFSTVSFPYCFESLAELKTTIQSLPDSSFEVTITNGVAWIVSPMDQGTNQWQSWYNETSNLLNQWQSEQLQALKINEHTIVNDATRQLFTYGYGRKALTSMLLQLVGNTLEATQVEFWHRPLLSSPQLEKEPIVWRQGLGLVQVIPLPLHPSQIPPINELNIGWHWVSGKRVWVMPLTISLTDSEKMVGCIVVTAACHTHWELSQKSILDTLQPLIQSAYTYVFQYDQAVMLANIDELTGLVNRRGFYQRFELELARLVRHGRPLGIALIDVDHFKGLNDAHGHMVGDQVLKQLSHLMTTKLRKTDLVSRFGGEEFALILPEMSEDSAFDLLERLRITVANEPFIVSGSEQALLISLRISAGLTLCNPPNSCQLDSPNEWSSTISTLLAEADQSLYEAKANGRNRVVYHNSVKDIV